MIASLEGTVRAVGLSEIVVAVGGIGYRVFVTSRGQSFTIGDSVLIHTYLAVRENALDLYGFTALHERDTFELLITLPKVGPKTALQILTQADTALIREAVLKEDPVYLAKMSGMGEKTAEKIVGGLKDKLGGLGSGDTEESGTSTQSDVADALISLGYSPKEIRDALRKIPETTTETDMVLKEALRHLSS